MRSCSKLIVNFLFIIICRKYRGLLALVAIIHDLEKNVLSPTRLALAGAANIVEDQKFMIALISQFSTAERYVA